MAPSMLDDEVVISGVGGRFPECDNLEEFKNTLFNATEVITNNDLRWKPGWLSLQKTLIILKQHKPNRCIMLRVALVSTVSE